MKFSYSQIRPIGALKLVVGALSVGLFVFGAFHLPVLAHHADAEVERNEQILRDLNNTQLNINAQIDALNASIVQIQRELANTQHNLEETQASIAALTVQIEELKVKIAHEKEVLGKLIQQLYADGQTSAVEILASSESFTDYINKTGYLDQVQQNVSETLRKIKDLKAELEQSKADLEAKQAELTNLRNQQLAQRSSLNIQLGRQQQLSSLNKKQIAVTQARLAELNAEYSRYTNAGCAKTYSGNIGSVSRGQVVAYEGSSGYSTGPHLHFETRSGGGCVNPEPFIRARTFTEPIQGCPNLSCMTQGYGRTSFNTNHTGIDLARPAGTPVLAADAGVVVARGYDGVSSCSENTYGRKVAGGCYVVIYHPARGVYSAYFHLSGFAV